MRENSIRTHSDVAPPIRETAPAREAMIMQHLTTVRAIAAKLSQRLPRCVPVEDLVSAGTLGLIAATDRFDPSRGLAFATYARHRVLGAMLDFLRDEDPLSRTARKTEPAAIPVTISLDQLTFEPAVHRQPRVEDRIDIANARKCLSARENIVVTMIYDHDRPAREIARLLGVNESRVSQIRHRAVAKLRQYWS